MIYYNFRSFVLLILLTSPLFAFQPPAKETDIARKAFSLPELYLSNMALPLSPGLALTNRDALNGFVQHYGSQTTVYLDPRSGAAMNLVTSIPMIPGDGKGNHVALSGIARMLRRPVKSIDSLVVGDLFLNFVKQNHDVYGIDVRQLGAPRVTQINDYLWHISIPQTVNGIPVRWGRLLAVMNHGNLILSGTETWGNVAVDTTPSIPAAVALKKGFDFVGGLSASDRFWKNAALELIPFSPPQFTLGEAFDGPLGSGYGHHLAWVFGFQRMPELARWEMAVDAHSGELLYLSDKNNYVDKKIDGGIYPLTNTGVCPTNSTCGAMQPGTPMPWADTGLAFTNGAGVFDFPTAVNVTTTLNGLYVRINDSCGVANESAVGSVHLGGSNGNTDCVSGGSSPGNTPASRSGFYEVNRIAETARGYLPLNTWLQSQLTANMNLPQTCNAFWDGSTINFYQSGAGCRNTGEIAAVFDHEWGHGLDNNDSNGTLSDSSEGYADIASMFRLWSSCIGYGFFQTRDQGCGTTADGTGFNENEDQNGGLHCDLDCSGVRDADWDKHADHIPDGVGFVCNSCLGGGGQQSPSDNAGPCGRETHCAAAPSRQAAWDFAARDLPTAGFDATTSFIIADKIFYQGSGNIGAWHNCTCPSSADGCGAGNAYMQWLGADDDDGDISNGTPHMAALYAAFNRHGIACNSPTPANAGCSGGPTTAPTVTVQPKHNQNVINWNSISGATSYFVFRSEGFAGCNFGKTLIATVNATTYTDNEVSNGRQYNYVVSAVGSSTSCFTPASSCVSATPIACAGVPEFTRAVFSCNDSVTLELLDSDLAGDGQHDVTVSSTIESGGETVTLNETGPSTGFFTGTIGTTPNAPAADGLLSVANGNTITVSYNDASACGAPQTTTATAAVDCIAPGISNVVVSAITEQSANVTWNTDEPANSKVTYGIAPGPPASIVQDPGTFTQAHSLNLTSLAQCSNYVFSVTSNDPATNSTTDNNSGNFYTFTTTGLGVRMNDDLESGGANWIAAGPTDAIWQISTCDAFSGTHSFKAGATACPGIYADNAVSTLTSANPFPLGPAGHGYHLTFHEKYDVEQPFDLNMVQASTDGGVNWITIDQYTGSSGGWIPKDYDLSAIGGSAVLIRFVLTTDAQPSGQTGWYIDDIRIARVTPCTGTLAHFDQTIVDSCPASGPGDDDGILDPGENVTLTLTAENLGLSGVTGVSAVVTSVTPGITITSPNVAFPDIPSQGFAASTTPITFSIDASVACRSTIDFTVNYTANEGTWSSSFSLFVGGGNPFSMLAEGFEAGFPATWTIINGGSGGGAAQTWTTANPNNRVMDPPFSGKFAIADSDAAGAFATQDEQLIAPSLNATTCAAVKLQFSNQFHFFIEGFNEIGDVDVSTDGGTNWTNTLSLTGLDDGYPTPNTKTVDLTSIAAFQPNVKLRFHYYNANNDFWWAIDNVTVTCVPRICHNCGAQACLFCDNFNDGALPSPTDWTFSKSINPWSEDGDNLVATSLKKTSAVAKPIFGGCNGCSIEAGMKTAGGIGNRVSLFGWYVDKNNLVELMMKQEQGRWLLRQRSGGVIVKKTKGVSAINPNQPYVARVTFDGTAFTVFVDGVQLFTMTPAASVPTGTVGFQVKKTTGIFDYITVN